MSGKRIKSLTISVHMTSCQFGTPGFDSQIVHVRSIKIKPNGRFKAQRNGQLTSVPTGSTIDNDGAMTIHGRLKGHKGSGQFDFFTFGGHSAESCDSGKVKFKVHH
ncbi:MAG: hypothetical protein JOZ73_06240 [Solirubrobacterales bacterium]|nr:hypothetical protein [Solirubrobacterales bacterium]